MIGILGELLQVAGIAGTLWYTRQVAKGFQYQGPTKADVKEFCLSVIKKDRDNLKRETVNELNNLTTWSSVMIRLKRGMWTLLYILATSLTIIASVFTIASLCFTTYWENMSQLCDERRTGTKRSPS